MSMIKIIKNVKICGRNNTETYDILLAGNKIARIAKQIDIGLDYAEALEGQGMIAMPGYVDQHVHVTGGGGEGGFQNRVPELMLSECIKGGVTTLVGLLGTDAATRSVENLVAKTKELKIGGLTAYCLTGAYKYPSPTITGSVEKDITFIEEIIGVKIAISDHRCSNPSREELIRVASEARLGGTISGKPGIVHIHVGAGKDCLDVIIDIVEKTDIPVTVFRPTHLGPKMEAALRFADLGGYIDFTTGVDPKATAGHVAEALKKAPAGSVTLSTDSNGSMPKWNERREIIGIKAGKITTMHETILSLVQDQGLELPEAVKVSTENVAKALNLYPAKGIIEEGSDADILLLDNRLSIDTVLAGGELMMRNKKVLKKGVFE